MEGAGLGGGGRGWVRSGRRGWVRRWWKGLS